MHAVGYDVKTGLYTNEVDFTGSSAAANTINWGIVAPYALKINAGRYEIPCVYAKMLSDDPKNSGEQVNLRYIQGAGFDATDYTVNNYDVVWLGLNDNEKQKTPFSVSQNYPNPFQHSTDFYVTTAKVSAISVEVYNSVGQIVNSQTAKNLGAGCHKFTIDRANLNQGIYFYTVRTSDFLVTKKMIVE